jgi:hypothetical protein
MVKKRLAGRSESAMADAPVGKMQKIDRRGEEQERKELGGKRNESAPQGNY